MRSKSGLCVRIALLAAIAVVIPACETSDGAGDALVAALTNGGGGGGGGSGGGGGTPPPAPPPLPVALGETEPNNVPLQADSLSAAGRGLGALPTFEDIDVWQFPAVQGTVYHIEVFAGRYDQFGWSNFGNSAQVTVLSPDEEYLVGHHPSFWNFTRADFDIPYFRATETGTHFIQVQPWVDSFAPGGSYVVMVSQVPGTAQVESEPNDTSATADAITPGTIHGQRVAGNDDFYSFTVGANTVVQFSMHGFRRGLGTDALGNQEFELYDSFMELRGTNGTTILQTNDDDQYWDAGIRYFITTAGTYFVRVTSSGGSGGEGLYAFTFDTFSPTIAETEGATASGGNDTPATAFPSSYSTPYSGNIGTAADVDLWSFQGGIGDVVHVYWFDFQSMLGALNNVNISFTGANGTTALPFSLMTENTFALNIARVTLASAGLFHVRVSGFATTTYAFRCVVVKTGTIETEPNNDSSTADLIPATNHVRGDLAAPGDQDFYSFTAVENEVVVFSIYGAQQWYGNGVDFYHGNALVLPDLTVFDDFGAQLQDANLNFSPTFGILNALATSELAFVAPANGTYYIRVMDAVGFSGTNQGYVLQKR